MRRRKTAEHRAEMEARAERRQLREQRSWQEGPTPGRAKEKPTTTDKVALAKIARNKQRDDRKKLKRLFDAARTAEGQMWHPSQGRKPQ